MIVFKQGPSVAPKKTIKAIDSASMSCGSGSDTLPREDISGKLTPNLIKNLGSPDWKVFHFSINIYYGGYHFCTSDS